MTDTAVADKPQRKCDECGSTKQPIFLYQDKVNRCLECATKYLPDSDWKSEGKA